MVRRGSSCLLYTARWTKGSTVLQNRCYSGWNPKLEVGIDSIIERMMLFDPQHASALKIQDMDPRDNIKWTITIDNDWTNVLMSIDNNCTNMLCCIQPVIHNKDDCILTGLFAKPLEITRTQKSDDSRLLRPPTSGFVYCAWQIWLQLPISAKEEWFAMCLGCPFFPDNRDYYASLGEWGV